MDKKDLKIEALLQTINNLTNQVADLRVDITILSNELTRLKNEKNEETEEVPSEDSN